MAKYKTLTHEDIRTGVLVRTIHGGPIMVLLNPEMPEFGGPLERAFCQWWSYDHERHVESFSISTLRLITDDEDPNSENERYTLSDRSPPPPPKKEDNPLSSLLATMSEVLQGLDIVHELKGGKVKVVSIDYGDPPCPPTKRSSTHSVADEPPADSPARVITEEEFSAVPGMAEMREALHPKEPLTLGTSHLCERAQPDGCPVLVEICDIGGVSKPCPYYPKSESACDPAFIDLGQSTISCERSANGYCGVLFKICVLRGVRQPCPHYPRYLSREEQKKVLSAWQTELSAADPPIAERVPRYVDPSVAVPQDVSAGFPGSDILCHSGKDKD